MKIITTLTHFFKLTLLAIILTTANFTSAHAQATWTAPLNPISIDIAAGGWTWVNLSADEKTSCQSATHSLENQNAILGMGSGVPFAINENGYNSILSTLITAIASGRSIQLRIQIANNGTFCYIERARLAPN